MVLKAVLEKLTESESAGYSDYQGLIADAVPKVFDSNLPTVDGDSEHLSELEKKILTHYLFWEIGEETIPMWLYQLNRKMNEILPYFNQLYETALIKYNPFDEVDYTKEIETSSESEGKSDGTETRETKSVSSDKSTFKNTDKSEDERTDSSKSVVADNRVTASDESTTGTDVTESDTKTDTSDKSSTVPSTVKKTQYDAVTDKETDTRTSTHSVKSGDVESTHTDAYSDTPEGTLSGVTSNTYLTNYRRTTDTVKDTQSTVDENGGELSRVKTGSVTETESGSSETTTTGSNSTKVSGSGTKSETKSGTVKNTGDTTTSVDGSSSGASSSVGEGESSASGEKSTDDQLVKSSTDSSTGSSRSLEHVKGKMSGTSFSSLLKEYRDTVINIDMMVIDELSVCFMNIF